jgi:hypothetical protein
MIIKVKHFSCLSLFRKGIYGFMGLISPETIFASISARSALICSGLRVSNKRLFPIIYFS